MSESLVGVITLTRMYRAVTGVIVWVVTLAVLPRG